MNRTQYEAIHGKQIKEPCKMCQQQTNMRARVSKMRHKARAQFARAKKAGIASGQVINLFGRDEITGWHYRIDTDMYTGQGSQ